MSVWSESNNIPRAPASSERINIPSSSQHYYVIIIILPTNIINQLVIIDEVDLDDSKKDFETRENKTKCKLTLVGIDITSYISVEEDKNSWEASAVDVGWVREN